MRNFKVNLFLVGAMKAGTTSFTDVLSSHSQIYGAPIKEPHFFVDKLPSQLYEPSRFFDLNEYLDNSFPEPLHITKIGTLDQYEKAFSLWGSEVYGLDSSTAYLHAPNAARMIHDYNKDARIIVLLRDPLKRAFSHYKMDFGKGRTSDSFETLIKKDIEAYKQGLLPWHSYLGMSLYRKQIEKYHELFHNVLIVNFEDLMANNAMELKKIARFLDIEDFSGVTVSHQNIARKPKFPKMLYLAKRLGLKDYFSKIFSGTFKQWVFKRTSSENVFEMTLSKSTQQQLEEIFNEHSKL